MTDEQLIEAMARAMFKDDQTCRLEIAKAIFEVCKPTIEAPLRAENEKLRAALKPFAEKADHHTQGAYWMDAVFTVDECRAAAAALKETGE